MLVLAITRSTPLALLQYFHKGRQDCHEFSTNLHLHRFVVKLDRQAVYIIHCLKQHSNKFTPCIVLLLFFQLAIELKVAVYVRECLAVDIIP